MQLVYATADEADAYMFYRCFFSVFCVFLFFFRPSKNMRQPFSGMAERIFMKLLPNNSGENVVCIAVPKFHTRALRHVRHMLSTELAVTIGCSIVASRLDYCNSVLYGAPSMSLDRLQRSQDMLARVVMQSSSRTSARPLLQSLHWLPI